jgi:hypothetical protein
MVRLTNRIFTPGYTCDNLGLMLMGLRGIYIYDFKGIFDKLVKLKNRNTSDYLQYFKSLLSWVF